MQLLLPLVALSKIPNFDNTRIPSENHFQSAAEASSTVWPWRSFKTSPHTPPNITITRRHGTLSDGYIFLTPSDTKSEEGTYELSGTGFIMTSEGDLVFAGEETGMGFCDKWIAGMTDFRRQEYNGRPYLTYWNGCNTKGAHWGHRWGRVTFIDDEYTNFTINPDLKINTLDDATRGQIDVHEHQMTDDNTMMVTSYNNTQVDLRWMDGPKDAWMADSMFFEIDIRTQEVLFKWQARDHMSLEASRFGFNMTGAGTTERIPWDWFHINSVQKVGENYLISARHHWAVYLISGKNGAVIWKLDGMNGGSFGSIPHRFRWQHHARAHNVSEHGMTVSLFDNHVNGNWNKRTQSRAMAFYLPMPASKKHPPQLVKELSSPKEMVFSGTQGSYQMDVGNGHGFVGYGKIPLAREYGPADDGSDLRWQARFGEDGAVASYRAFKATWHGTPKNWDPVVMIEEAREEGPKVYVSWNGATDITSWALWAGHSPDSLKSFGVVKKMGFETVFDLNKATCVQLGAIRDGRIIRASNVACLHPSDEEVDVGIEADKQSTEEEVDVDVEADKQSADEEGSVPDKADKQSADDKGSVPDEAELARLKAENAHLQAEVQDMEKELGGFASGEWASYRLFAEVACAVALMVAVTWAYVLWRDCRHRRQFEGDYDNDTHDQSDGLISRLAIPVFKTRRTSRRGSDRIAGVASETYEAKLDDYAPRNGDQGEVDADSFSLPEDEDGGGGFSGVNARTPFMRQASMIP